MSQLHIVAFAGSTRKDSYNKVLVRLAAEMAEEAGARVTLLDLADFPAPLYDGDLESDSGLPEKAAEFKKLLDQADAFLIASPEYNSSISAVLKNSIDWASRPGAVEGSVFDGKTCSRGQMPQEYGQLSCMKSAFSVQPLQSWPRSERSSPPSRPSSRSGRPPSSKMRRPVVVLFPLSTWPQMTMERCSFSELAVMSRCDKGEAAR